MSTKPALATSRRLRIAVLSRNFSTTGGGAERYSISLVEQLCERHEIHVFAQNFDHPIPGVTLHKVSQPLKRPRWINQLWFALATWWATRRDFDVVHSHENTWHGQIQTVHVLPVKHNLFFGRTGISRVLRWLKILSSPRLLVYLWLEYLRYRVKGLRRIVLTSDSLKTIMTLTYPEAADAMRVITPGVSAVAEPVNAAGKQAARKLLGLPLDGKCILFVGNDFRKKGLPTLLGALQKLSPEYFLAVVGNPQQVSLVREDLRTYTVEHRVFFLGNLGDIHQAYRAADCLAHPTLEDTFAMVVLEAMAFGLPVVVSNSEYCGISELLSHGVDAMLLKNPRDPDELCANLIQIFSNQKLADTLTSGGRNFARQRLWSEMALVQEQLYFEVAA